MRWIIFSFLMTPFLAVSAASELIEVSWLAKPENKDSVVIIDVQEEVSFNQHHMPGSVNLPYSRWRTGGDSPMPGNLPDVATLEKMLGTAGIAADDHVLLVATGLQPGDLSAMARVFWTLKVLGHEKVSLLNGGLASYARNRVGPLMRGRASAAEPKVYKARPDRSLLAEADDVLKAKTVDARSPAEYLGLMSGGEGERPGTLKASANLNYSWLAEEGGGRLRSLAALKKLFAKAAVPDVDGLVHFCHTGNRASLTWFVDYALLGHREAKLYDASMLEWARDPKRPLVRLWELD